MTRNELEESDELLDWISGITLPVSSGDDFLEKMTLAILVSEILQDRQ